MFRNYDDIRKNVVGTVEFVSPKEIKVLLDIEAPLNTAINSGVPQLFPRINGFLLIPNESGALIGLISWIGIEYSPYPKRKGYKDFDLVDLPFPLRKVSLSPIGILKETEKGFEVERGVYSYPSVGDIVIIPSTEHLKAIVQNESKNAKVQIGVSPLTANAPVFIDPDKMFGRHLAVLGNTGSGKSCSVAGLIRWSIEAANKELVQNAGKDEESKKVNARFIILDPNGEYGECFDDLTTVQKFKVKLNDEEGIKQLKVPSWMWNSWEWISIAQASARTQRPILRQALREIKNANKIEADTISILFRNFLASLKISLMNFRKDIVNLAKFPGNKNYWEFLNAMLDSLSEFNNLDNELSNVRERIKLQIQDILENNPKEKKNDFINYPSFNITHVNSLLNIIEETEDEIGKLIPYNGPDEDIPIFFNNAKFLAYIQQLSQESNVHQYMDFFIMRVRSLFTDQRIFSVINTKDEKEVTLEQWLNEYIGNNEIQPSINVIDLSLLPSEILYLVTAVMARIILEAHQRYKKTNGNILPSVLIVDEAHNLIKRYNDDDENISSQRLCTQIFEKIAKEGRKFGVGLMISSQRPSELSQTVLSQCNTFLLHRIVSDRDQEMVKKLVPDSMGKLLDELPILPTRKAILLGWAAPIPVLVEMNELKESQTPKSKDPDYWNVWIGKEERILNWNNVVEEWQNKKT